MANIKPRTLIVFIVLAVSLLAGWLVYSFIHNRPLTSRIEVQAAPSGVHISIDGQKGSNGVNRVRPGKHHVQASRDGFASNSTTINIQKGESKYVGFILNPNSAATANWYNDHPKDQLLSQTISSKISDSQAQQTADRNPILTILPFEDDRTGFKIDYGVSKAHPKDPSAIGIYITANSQSAANAALGWLRFSGYDPTKLEIIYRLGESDQ